MQVTDPRIQADRLRSWKSGQIVMKQGRLVSIRRRLWCTPASIASVWFHTRYRIGAGDECVLDYHSSRPGGYIVLDYIRSGSGTQLATFRGACRILDEVARLREAVAIFAHVSTEAISDRLLERWGWEPHTNMRGRHWVKRFYNGYGENDISRYLCDMSDQRGHET